MLAVGRLAALARRRGELRESDCEKLPSLSTPVGPLISTAEKVWQEERRKHGEKGASVRTVVFNIVRWPLGQSCLLLTLRGFGNAFVLPLLLNSIIDSVVQLDIQHAAYLLCALIAERMVGAMIEFWGYRLASTRIATDFTMAVTGLVVAKSSSPGLLGLQEAGVDPAALVGRELAMLHAKAAQMLPNGLISLPTLFAGCTTLILLLGWSAIVGVAWILFTIRFGIQVQEYAKKAEGQMAVVATERLGVLGNVVAAIKAIKYFAWEPEFLTMLLDIRASECQRLKTRARFTALAIGIGKLTPVTGSLVTFITYALLGNEIKAGVIFAANSIFMTLRFSVGASSFLSELWKTTSLTLSRVDKLLALPERTPPALMPADASALASIADLKVTFPKVANGNGEAGGFVFSAKGPVELGCKGKLTAVCGPVGSGKSVLVSSLLGSVDGDASIEGQARIVSDVGWCPQKPFVISGTIEENILLGRPLDPHSLERCIADACLGMDLGQWSGGMDEMVGERGTTMSGGQQARLGLARALYGNPSLLLLDDPLAAVDATVGRAMLHALRVRCAEEHFDWHPHKSKPAGAIVVLNQLQLLPNFDQIVFVKAGVVAAVGSFDELQSNKEFRDFMQEIELQERPLDAEQDLKFAAEERTRVSQRLSTRGMPSIGNKALVQKEAVASGFVRWVVWRSYLFAPGRCFFVSLLGVYVNMYLTLAARDWWMTVWADADGGSDSWYIGVFVIFGLSHIGIVILSISVIGTFAERAGRHLHSECVEHLMHAPMSYFDKTPSGRITSRLGPDLAMVDSTMAIMIDVVLTFSFMAIMMSAAVMAEVPIMAAIFVAAVLVSLPVFQGLAIFRQDSKRHSNNAMAPMLSNLNDLRRGAMLVASMNCEDFFISRHRAHAETWRQLANACMFTTPISQSWCHFMHFFVLTTTGALTFYQAETLAQNPGLVAMYLSYASLWGLFAMVTMGAIMGLLTNGASLERLVEFKLGELPQESDWRLPSDPSSKAWPSNGALCFHKVSLRYREGLPLALRDFSIDIAAGEKIGIVGRTGAGKSTITAILFRLVECEEGRVTIDGVDIASLGLHTLRKAISMIPQEPIVMNGTVRYNLDPFGNHDDKKLLSALATAGLLPAVSLDTAASGSGAGLSAGQKQLLTFARTLLQDTRVVMMDEPTASVDMQTDRFVQSMSREAFASRTVLTIAHRLDTVRHCDRLAVLDAGQLVELGPPDELLADPQSRLSRLVASEGSGAVGQRGKLASMLGQLALRVC